MVSKKSSTLVRLVSLVVSLVVVAVMLVPMAGMGKVAKGAEKPGKCRWNVEYFSDTELTQRVSEDCENPDVFITQQAISYTWAKIEKDGDGKDKISYPDDLPPGITDPHNFSARWKGRFNFSKDHYLFGYKADDGIRVYIDGKKIIDQWTSKDGESEQYLQPGEHEIVVEYRSTSKDEAKLEFGWIGIQPKPPLDSELTPIVFVPGYWNCAKGDSFYGQWENLPATLALSAIYNLRLAPPEILAEEVWPPAAIALSPFFNNLFAQGYEMNKNLFIACYDWSGTMDNASKNVATVLETASRKGTIPVAIITHSTGALVTRYYIQNNPTVSQKMVKDLFLIAPPNQGVAKFYYTWEGGLLNLKGLDPSYDKPELVSLISNPLMENFTSASVTYKCEFSIRSLTKEFALLMSNQELVYNCLRRRLHGYPDSTIIEPVGSDNYADIILKWDERKNSLPVATWFLPEWNFLITSEGTKNYPSPLAKLNYPEEVEKLFQGIQGNIHVLTGEIENSTLYKITVAPYSPENYPLWKAGRPVGYTVANGDGTVLLKSSEIPLPEGDFGKRYKYNPFKGDMVNHIDILGNRQVLEYLHQYLNIKSTPYLPSLLEVLHNYLAISVHSPANILVTSPSGQQFGMNGSGEFLNIPDSIYQASDDPTGEKHIYIFNPEEGNYQIEVTGVEPGGEYMLYVSSLGSEPLGVRDTIAPNEVKTYNVRFVSSEKCTTPGPCVLAGGSVALPESSVFAAPTFQNYWQANTALWGNPISDGMREPYAGKPDGVRQVQYFEKSRMEINDASQPHNVTNGLLVREMIEGRIQVGDAMYDERSPAEEAVAGDPTASNPNAPTYASFRGVSYPVNATRSANRVGQVVTEVLAKDGSVSNTADLARYGIMLGAYDEQLGHNIPTVFTSYLASHGIDQMAVAGLPLSEPYWARVNVGGVEKDVLIQVFERRVMTYTPDNPAAWQVEMGNVGQHYMTWRYSQ